MPTHSILLEICGVTDKSTGFLMSIVFIKLRSYVKFLEISRLKEEIETCSKLSKIFCEIVHNIKRHIELILFLNIVSNGLVLGTRYVSYSFNEINKQTMEY